MPATSTSPAPATRETILIEAIPLFARAGYAGVSVRDVAALVGISAAALYHHFPDKQSLYVAAVQHAFRRIDNGIKVVLESDSPPLERLQAFVELFVAKLAQDPDLRRLLQRELLDADDTRMALLVEHVFREPHLGILALARDLATDLDPFLLANSVVGLVLVSLQCGMLHRHLPGGCSGHESPEVIGRHVVTLLTRALAPREGA